MLNQDLKDIKKYYGENMMHLCRELFPSLLEQEGLLFRIISDHFDYSKLLYDDIIAENMEEEFKDFIYSFIDVEKEKIITNKSPKELLDEAGYDLYECHTEKDIQSFKKYYEEDEVLCTIKFGGRLNRCHVFFAVKKDVDRIKRSDFKKPNRQDEYGTSVISIQFRLGQVNTVSIKNRYNHTVNNPDATFGNNLDSIILGLTDAFEREYGFNINSSYSDFELNSYYLGSDGKFYKINYEVDDICFGSNNVLLENGRPNKLDKARYVIMDYFVLDKVEKTIKICNEDLRDTFADTIGHIDKIEEFVDKKTKERTIVINDKIKIVVDKIGVIIKFVNEDITEIDDNFLSYNPCLQEIEIPNVTKIGNNFLRNNRIMLSFKSEKLTEVGEDFLYMNTKMSLLKLPNLLRVGDNFMYESQIDHISFPKLKYIGDHFMCENQLLSSILFLPEVEIIGKDFLYKNIKVNQVIMPLVEKVGLDFISSNSIIESVFMPKLKKTGSFFLSRNKCLTYLKLDSLEEAGDMFLRENKLIDTIILPKVKKICGDFCYRAFGPINIELPEVEEIGPSFLSNCEEMERIELPKAKTIMRWFLPRCKEIHEVILPEAIDICGEGFLRDSDKKKIERFYAPKYIEQLSDDNNPKFVKELKLKNKNIDI